jgi:hypothetical protein
MPLSARSPVLVRSLAISLLTPALALAGMAAPALASGVPLQPATQVRKVTADTFVLFAGGNDQHIEERSAPGFGLFDETIDASAALANGTATLLTEHVSRIAPFGIEADLSTASNSALVAAGGFCYSVGGASCIIGFDLAAPTVARIRAALDAGANGEARLLVNGPGGSLYANALTGDDATIVLNLPLPAGRTTITLSTVASTALGAAGTMTDLSSARLHLSTSASPADLDLDGSVGSADLAILIGAWSAPGGVCLACPADLDGDGVVGASDLATLIGAWTP